MKYPILLLLLLLSACSTLPSSPEPTEPSEPSGKSPSTPAQEQSTTTPAPPSTGQPIGEEKPNSYGWKWNYVVQGKLTPKMLAFSQQPLCKKQIDGTRFWLALARSIAYAESLEWRAGKPLKGKVDPSCSYTENFVDHLTGKLAESVGLFQLSVGDKLNYKNECKTLTAQTLRDPVINTACAVEIMHTLLGTRKNIQEDLGRYWSTIQNKAGARAVARLYIELPECK